MKRIPSDPVEAWRPVDESVGLTFEDVTGVPQPCRLRWRGSLWHVLGPSRHWSTWRALPSTPTGMEDVRPIHPWRTDFWRFRAQTGPVSPILHFEVRRAGTDWRLVRLGATFDLPPAPRTGATIRTDRAGPLVQ
ncbi:hypothetical protein C4K88_06035 [Arthrobacter pityocampae]|uniref:Uncharacterized protein n=1 Tax=Arthrobacter pityocampae TaxID=547334 RepID=A0A2S5J048_9MICC|nr:hypothetical protein [Arthrobacter pityocampae]PPB50216.1 hypothetical protein C4K88_06035 [Arthrobacter pityocampae]